MAAKVALDKLDKRLFDLVHVASSARETAPRDLLTIRTLAQDILHHIRTDDKTPEQGVSDYELEGELARVVTGILYDIDAGVA
jgi:hypothetical protein